jgi:hypothetical protein
MLAPAENRKHKRFVPERSAFVVFRPEFRKVGPINDISRGGLRCSYLSPVDEEKPAAETSHLVDILISNNGFHLSNIPCNSIYDVNPDNDQVSVITDLVARQCGLKFNQLTEEQDKQINFFLENHTARTT